MPPVASARVALRTFLAAGVLLLLSSTLVRAQTPSEGDETVAVGGLVQAEATYGWITGDAANDERSRLGFGLRRTRLRVTGRAGPRVGVFLHGDADAGDLGILDAFAWYDASPQLRLRLGRMASAQPRAFILTPVVAMDANERAAVALLWHGGTLGAKGRDFGIDLRYQTAQSTVILFLHNGDGSFDRLRGNYQQNIVGDVTGGLDRGLDDMAASAYAAFRPAAVAGLELGGYAGYNGSRNPHTAVNGVGRAYASYAAHAYWGAKPGSQPLRLKADVIGVQYEEVGSLSQHTLGLSVLGAAAVHPAAEVVGRFEMYDPNANEDVMRTFFVTAGMSFSPSRLRGRPYPQQRLTLAYNARISEEEDAPLHHLLVLQLQVNF